MHRRTDAFTGGAATSRATSACMAKSCPGTTSASISILYAAETAQPPTTNNKKNEMLQTKEIYFLYEGVSSNGTQPGCVQSRAPHILQIKSTGAANKATDPGHGF